MPKIAQTKKKSAHKKRAHEHFHADGSLWARGELDGKVMEGYWEWFRKDGTRMRAGSFLKGEQVGDWTTFAKDGRVVKVTRMKSARVDQKAIGKPEKTPKTTKTLKVGRVGKAAKKTAKAKSVQV